MSITVGFSRRSRHYAQALEAFGLAICASSALASPWNWMFGEEVGGSGAVKQQVREVAPFTAVSLDMPANVEVRQGNTERVTISSDDNLLALIDTRVDDGTLHIGAVKRHARLKPSTLTILIEAKRITALTVGNAGTIHVDKLDAGELRASVGGSGSIRIVALQGKRLNVALGGSGSVDAGGAADAVTAAIGGSGTLKLGQLDAKTVSVSLGGSGHGVVWAREKLSVSLAGSGSIGYYGDPALSKASSGSASLTRLGPAPR